MGIRYYILKYTNILSMQQIQRLVLQHVITVKVTLQCLPTPGVVVWGESQPQMK